LFGYANKEELIGQKIEILIPRRYHKNHVGYRTGYSKQPVKRQMGKAQTLYGIKKSGEEFPVEIGLNSYEHEGERKILALVTDITKRNQQEEIIHNLNIELEKKVETRTKELKKSQELYRLISQNFPNGTISVFNRELKYIFIEGSELFRRGITSSQLIGKPYLDLVPKEAHALLKEKLASVFHGNTEQFDVSFGDSFYEINAVPLNQEDGIEQILVVEKNITKLKMAEVELERALQHEKDLNELKSRFVSMASHEFRTPLSTISSSATLLSKYQETAQQEKRDKHIGRIKGSVSNLIDILNDFLSLSKLEEGMIQPEKEMINLCHFLDDIQEEISTLIDNGQTIDLRCEEKIEFYSDQKLIRNIMINLLSNAIKYSFENSMIKCGYMEKEETIEIYVENEGIGIPLAEQKNLFTRFFRAENAVNIKGTGLGLNIVQKYVSLLEGTISFQSIPNETTTFTVSIPKIKP
jgi:PAS domain S-box-containing protein